MPRSNQPWAAMIATADDRKMITLPNAPNASAAISPPNNGPAFDGAPVNAKVAAMSSATADQLVSPEPRRPVNAATIISTSAPAVRISSGRMGISRFISAPPSGPGRA